MSSPNPIESHEDKESRRQRIIALTDRTSLWMTRGGEAVGIRGQVCHRSDRILSRVEERLNPRKECRRSRVRSPMKKHPSAMPVFGADVLHRRLYTRMSKWNQTDPWSHEERSRGAVRCTSR